MYTNAPKRIRSDDLTEKCCIVFQFMLFISSRRPNGRFIRWIMQAVIIKFVCSVWSAWSPLLPFSENCCVDRGLCCVLISGVCLRDFVV